MNVVTSGGDRVPLRRSGDHPPALARRL